MDIAEIQRAFGQRVQSLRKQRGLTQEALAEAIGKSVDTISNVERGFSATRIETAFAIATALGTTLADLFDFQYAAPADRERRKLVNDLLELLRTVDAPTIEAIIAQAEILLRVKERAAR